MSQDTISQSPTPRGRVRAWMLAEGRSILLVLVLLTLARTSFANHYRVPTGSMEPTLRPGDRVLVDMRAYGLRLPFTDVQLIEAGTPQRGDVVVFKSPADGTRLIKRVVAVAGDRVQLVDGRLSIDGRVLAWPGEPDVEVFGARRAQLGLDMGGGPDIAPVIIPAGKLLVLGDHRGDSEDGRYFLRPGRCAQRLRACAWRVLAPRRRVGVATAVTRKLA